MRSQHAALTNAEIEATKTPEMRKAARGCVAQVSISKNLLRSYCLIRGTGAETNNAEIRDGARSNLVIYSGTYAECVAEANRLGLWC